MKTGASVVAELRVNRRGESRVDVLVRCPVFAAELRPDVDDVAERPQTFVGKAAVVGGERRLLEPQPAQRVGRILGRHQRPCRPRRPPAGRPMPAPCAIQTPPRSRISASSATATPPVAALTVMRPSASWLCRYGSRFETTTSGRGACESSSPACDQPAAEQERADQFVDGDRRRPAATAADCPSPGNSAATTDAKPERDARLRDQSGPRILADRLRQARHLDARRPRRAE